MKSTPKVFVLTLLFWWSIVTPSKANNPTGIIDGIVSILIVVFAFAFVLLTPIVTAILGVVKNNQKLKMVSEGFSIALITAALSSFVISVGSIKILTPFLILTLAGALPLIILQLYKNKN
ncbi:hypothetical protein [Microscilla marina]|nr:hypothetical protein [Microscilla marina]